MDYRELLRNLRLRPGMYLPGSSLSHSQLVAYVSGLAAGQPGLLAGFREFLILKLDDGNHLAWPSLVVRLVVPDAARFQQPGAAPLSPTEDQAAVEGLFEALDEFLAETQKSGPWPIYGSSQLTV